MLACPLCRIVLLAEGPCPRDGHDGVEVALLPVPTEVERRFRVLEPFAVGGTGTLYLADDGETGRRGLVKLLRARDRSRAHRELLRQVSLGDAPRPGQPSAPPHPGAVPLGRVWVAGESAGVTWLFREWLDGVSLAVRLHRDGPIPLPEAVAIAYAVAGGLDDLHRAGLVHRNVHPGHVILCPRQGSAPRIALIDAGIAAPCPGAPERVLGVPATISPEVARGEPATFRSDLYALGCVLHHALSGVPPFPLADPAEVVAAHREAEPPPPPAGLPTGLGALVSSLLAKDPKDRPLSAQQLRRRLRPYLPEGEEEPREPTLAFDLRSHTGAVRSAAARPGDPAPRASVAPPPPSRFPPPSAPAPAAPASARPPPPRAPRSDEPTQPLDPEDLERLGPASVPPESVTGGFGGARWSTPPPPPAAPAPGRAPDTAGVSWAGLTGRWSPADSEPGVGTAPPSAPDEHGVYTPPPPPSRPSGSRPSTAFTPTPTPPPSRWPPPRKDAAPVAVFRRPSTDRPTSAPALSPIPPAPRLPELGPAPRGDGERGSGVPAPASIPPGSLPPPSGAPAGTSGPHDAVEAGPVPSSAPSSRLPPPRVPGRVEPAPDDAIALDAELAPDDAIALDAEPIGAPGAGTDEALDATGEASGPPPFAAASVGAAPGTGSSAASSLPPAPRDAVPASPEPPRSSSVPPVATPRPDEPLSPSARELPAAAPMGLWDFLLAQGWVTLAAIALFAFVAGTALVTWATVSLMRWSAASAPIASSQPSSTPLDGPEAPSADRSAPTRPAEAETAPPGEPEAVPAPAPDVEPEPAPRAAPEPPTARERPPAEARAPADRAEAPRPRRRATTREARPPPPEAAPEREPAAGSEEVRGAFARARQEGRAHFAGRRYALAAEAYERATRLEPRHAGSFAGLGAARAAAGDVAGAVEAYERAVALSPGTSGFHAALGRVRLRAGDRAGAINAYQRALAIDPSNAAARTALDRLGAR